MNRREVIKFGALAIALLAVQALTLRGVLRPVGQLCLYLSNLFALFMGMYSVRPSKRMDLNFYVLGYLTLFVLFFILARQPLLLALFVILYAALYHVPGAIGYLFIFAFSFALFAPFSLPVFALASLFYTGIRWLVLRRAGLLAAICYVLGFLLFAATLLPMLQMSTMTSFQDLTKSISADYVQDAIRLSVVSSSISTAVIVLLGVPLAYVMVRWRFRGRGIADTLIDIPILIPQPVVGIALLTMLGPKTSAGQFLYNYFGIEIAGSVWGICAAQIFVSSPFLIRGAMTAFQAVDERLEYAAQTLGAHPIRAFLTITLPLASKGIFYGCILSWARAISEFGSLTVIAYKPATAPVLIHDIFTQYGLSEARPLSVLLVVVCLWAFVALRVMRTWSPASLFTRAALRPYDTNPASEPSVG